MGNFTEESVYGLNTDESEVMHLLINQASTSKVLPVGTLWHPGREYPAC